MAVINTQDSLLYAFTDADYQEYTFYTGRLRKGDYKFRLYSIDNLGNRTQQLGSDLEVTISDYPDPATNFAVSYDSGTGKATISWTASADADHYEVYDNDGDTSCPAPNFGTGLLDTTSSTSYETGVLGNGTWYFGVRVVDADSVREENLIRIGPVYVPGEDTANIPEDPGVPGDVDENDNRYSRIEFERVSVGKLTLSFLYFGSATATHFHVYVGIDADPDFDAAPMFEFDRDTGQYRQEYTTATALHSQEDTTVHIAIKAASATNVESDAEDIYQIDIDGIAPEAPADLTITGVS